MSCPSVSDILRQRNEFLGPKLHHRASWMDVWLNLIPRGLYEKGTGFTKSSFKIQRSEPQTEEEQWAQILNIANSTANETNNSVSGGPGTGNLTYNQVFNGELEDQYVPEAIGLRGPVINQDTLTHYWNSEKFWMSYFEALEHRNVKTVINRLGNIYRNYCFKMAVNSNYASNNFVKGKWGIQPSPQNVDLSDFVGSEPTSQLTQQALDFTAVILNQEGADMGDTQAWIQQGPDGPIYPLLIGQEASNYILQNNSELRSDFNQSFMGWKEANPVIQRMGASRVIKNFRHVINRFPARWAEVALGGTVQYTSYGSNGTTSANYQFQATIGASISTSAPASTNYPAPPAGYGYVSVTLAWNGSGSQPASLPTPSVFYVLTLTGKSYIFLRIPTWVMSTLSSDVTSGLSGQVNGSWNDPTIAVYESCEVLNPLVMTEEIVEVQQSLPGAKLNPQNYFGEWDYVTGNDAFLGMDGCTGIADPKKKAGRHFAEYRHALEPVLPMFGRMLVYIRCSTTPDLVTCS